jgi:hypothetical protein
VFKSGSLWVKELEKKLVRGFLLCLWWCIKVFENRLNSSIEKATWVFKLVRNKKGEERVCLFNFLYLVHMKMLYIDYCSILLENLLCSWNYNKFKDILHLYITMNWYHLFYFYQAMELHPIMLLNSRKHLLGQKCLMEPGDSRWDEADLPYLNKARKPYDSYTCIKCAL